MGKRRRWRRKRRVIFKRGPSRLAVIFLVAAIAAWGLLIVVSGVPVYAWVYYRVRPRMSERVGELLVEEAKEASRQVSEQEEGIKEESSLPSYDVSLPDGHWLKIEKIGVDTAIREADYDNYEEALGKGVWRVPDFGQPGEEGRPMILAAHRFGYWQWSQEYRERNSFFNLPKLKLGDEVEVVWDKRVFRYKVVKVEEGEKISDYGVDLILYTCRFWAGPGRYFVYLIRRW